MIRRPLLLGAVAATVAACAGPGPGPSMTAAAADPETPAGARLRRGPALLRNRRVESADDPLEALDTRAAGVAAGSPAGCWNGSTRVGGTVRRGVYRAMIGAVSKVSLPATTRAAAEDKPALAVTEATARQWDSRDPTALVDRCARVSVGAATGSMTPDAVGECALALASRTRNRVNGVRRAARGQGDCGLDHDGQHRGSGRRRRAGRPQADTHSGGERRRPLPAQRTRPDAVAGHQRIAGVLDTAALTGMLRAVRSGADAEAVAEQWLAENPLGR